MSSHFELPPAAYESRREGHMQRRRMGIVSETIERYSAPGATVLEFGCGPGALIARLAEDWPDRRFLGVDFDASMLRHAQRAHHASNLEFRLVDLERTGVDAGASVAFSVDVVHHIHEVDSFLVSVGHSLAPRAVWVVVEPNIFHPYVFVSQERMKRRGLDEDHFRPWAFERAARAAGFTVESRRTAFVVPGSVERLPRSVRRMELALERVPFLGGSVVYVLRAVEAGSYPGDS